MVNQIEVLKYILIGQQKREEPLVYNAIEPVSRVWFSYLMIALVIPQISSIPF
jgi:hypothetical protein